MKKRNDSPDFVPENDDFAYQDGYPDDPQGNYPDDPQGNYPDEYDPNWTDDGDPGAGGHVRARGLLERFGG